MNSLAIHMKQCAKKHSKEEGKRKIDDGSSTSALATAIADIPIIVGKGDKSAQAMQEFNEE